MSRDLLALSIGFSDRLAYSVQGFLGGPPGGESETPSRSYNYSIDLNVYPSTSPKRLFHRGKSPFRSKPSAGLVGRWTCGIFDSIFVPATKGPAQILMYPISPDRKLLLGRRLSPRYIPSHPALSFQLAPLLQRYQARNLFRW